MSTIPAVRLEELAPITGRQNTHFTPFGQPGSGRLIQDWINLMQQEGGYFPSLSHPLNIYTYMQDTATDRLRLPGSRPPSLPITPLIISARTKPANGAPTGNLRGIGLCGLSRQSLGFKCHIDLEPTTAHSLTCDAFFFPPYILKGLADTCVLDCAMNCLAQYGAFLSTLRNRTTRIAMVCTKHLFADAMVQNHDFQRGCGDSPESIEQPFIGTDSPTVTHYIISREFPLGGQ